MKLIISFCVVGILLLSGFGAGAELLNIYGQTKEDLSKMDYTHTVLAEFATAQTCPYCVYAHGALKNIYNSGSYPFYYVTLPLGNKNVHATARAAEYNVYYIPDVFFDGGYKVECGASDIPSAQAIYLSYINECGARTVKDIFMTLEVSWLGNGAMDIGVSVQNNESSEYSGHIRVFVTEKISSMGWYDNSGQLYTFPFLDYAFNENILISGNDEWADSITWDGHDYNDGYGHNFGNIQQNNIVVVAAIYNSEVHQGYSYPPNQYPFNAYYIDEVVGATPGEGVNYPPDEPNSPHPSDKETDISLEPQLSWMDSDPNNDELTFDVYFGTTSQPPKVITGQAANSYVPGVLVNQTTYYWQIVAWDEHGESTAGPVWSFTTTSNYAPNKPNITGPLSGKPGVDLEYTFLAIDPNGDELNYYIIWGETNDGNWMGPFASGEEVKLTHQYAEKGTYVIKAKVKDPTGIETGYSTLEISIPRYKTVAPSFFLKLLEKFQIFQLIKNLF